MIRGSSKYNHRSITHPLHYNLPPILLQEIHLPRTSYSVLKKKKITGQTKKGKLIQLEEAEQESEPKFRLCYNVGVLIL